LRTRPQIGQRDGGRRHPGAAIKEPTMPTRLTRAACTALALGLLAAAPLALGRQGADDPVRAGGDDTTRARGGDGSSRGGDRSDVRVRGTCSAASSAKLKLSPENGRVEVEFEVDQNRVGTRWGVVLTRNGTRVLSRGAVTLAPSGSFEVRRVVAPGSPSTRVSAVARAVGSGEICRAVAVLA
jgi:hypothetical protein